jgi:hypothetical protein
MNRNGKAALSRKIAANGESGPWGERSSSQQLELLKS